MTCQKNERDVHHTIWHFFSWEFVQTCPWVPDYFGSVCFCGKGENLSEQLSELTTNLTHKWRRQVAQVAGKFHTRRKTIFTRMHTLYELDFLAIWHCMEWSQSLIQNSGSVFRSCFLLKPFQAWVFQTFDSAIHHTQIYVVDSVVYLSNNWALMSRIDLVISILDISLTGPRIFVFV